MMDRTHTQPRKALSVERSFRPSRLSTQQLAIAYERLLPVRRCRVGVSDEPSAGPDLRSVRPGPLAQGA